MMADVAVGEVLKIVGELADGAVRANGFMDAAGRPVSAPSIVEPELEIRIPIRRPDPSAEVPGHTRHAIAGMIGARLERGADVLGQLRRDALVGIDRENPVVARLARREVLLRRIPGPVAPPRAPRARPFNRVVRAVTVDDEDSSAHASDARQASMFAASLSVMTVAVTGARKDDTRAEGTRQKAKRPAPVSHRGLGASSQ
jgi:hypothetical protein